VIGSHATSLCRSFSQSANFSQSGWGWHPQLIPVTYLYRIVPNNRYNGSMSGVGDIKSKTCALVNFLYDLVKSKYKSYPLYSKSKNQVLWLAELDALAEKYENVEHAFGPNPPRKASEPDDISTVQPILKLRKPPLNPAPEIPKNLAHLLRYERAGTNVTLRLTLQSRSEKKLTRIPYAFVQPLTADAERLEALTTFLRQDWARWRKDAGKVYGIYEELYRFRNKLEAAGSIELVLAIGLLQRSNTLGIEIERHVLTLRCEIELDAKTGELTVVPLEGEEQLQLELDFIGQDDRPDEQNPDLQEAIKELSLDFSDREKVESVLRILSNLMRAPSTINIESLRKSRPWHDRYLWSFAPALILRQRRPKAHLQLLERARAHCDDDQLPLRTEAMAYFLAEGDVGEENGNGLDRAYSDPISNDVYFPLPTNKEQLAIVKKVEKQPVVVVKGPPGTGKSHTIANLISHTLATGGRVLVTAEKGAALTVVRDKLPKNLQALCITALGSSKKDREALEQSLKALIDTQEQWNASAKEKEAERLRKERTRLREKLKKLDGELLTAREAEVKEWRLAGGYGGKAAEIVRQVNHDQSRFEWFVDDMASQAPFPLSESEVNYLVEFHESLNHDDLDNLKAHIPEELPDIETVQRYFQGGLSSNAGKVAFPASAISSVAQDSLELTREVVGNYKKALRALSTLIDQTFLLNYIQDTFYENRTQYWREHTQRLKALAKELAELREQAATSVVEFMTDPLAFKDAVAKRISFLRSGKPHRVFFRRARELSETDHVLDGVVVDGRPPESLKALSIVYRSIELHRLIKDIDDLLPPSVTTVSDPALAAGERLDRVNAFFRLQSALAEAINKLSWLDEEHLELLMPDGVTKLSEIISYAVDRDIAERKTNLLSSLKKLAKSDQAHSCVDKLRDALELNNLDLWQDSYREYAAVRDLQIKHAHFEKIIDKLASAAPKTAKAIRSSLGKANWGSRLRELERAWHWAATRGWIRKYVEYNRVAELQQERVQTYNKFLKTTEELSALMAHQALFSRFDQKTKVALRAWAKAMRRIGKGTGKHAEKHRESARKYMREIKDRLPAWIMPLDRLWDTVTIDSEPFDLVIIDEASQAGIDSLLLLGFSKRIVVVGDDKQNSPHMVGVEEDLVGRYIRQHLGGFRLADEFRPDSSLYDLSYLISSDNITLVEHYRCVPEIIRFNNREFYDGALIPLRQPPPNALDPLRLVYLPNAVSEGENQNIFNRIEAEAIVNQLIQLLDDPAYAEKTFGIVVLQGSKQIRLIEQLLTKRLDASKLEGRRIRVGASSDFQGDERDVIFLSMVVDNHQRIRSLTGLSDERRYNVAVSRARDQLWLFTSRDLTRLSEDDLRYRLVKYIQNPDLEEAKQVEADYSVLRNALMNMGIRQDPPDPYDSWFEVKVAIELLKRGYRVLPQFQAGAYRIDLVIEGLRNRLAVECDGDYWHGPDRYIEDMERQFQLERAGWVFVRVLESEFYSSPTRAIDRVVRTCQQMGIEPVLGHLGKPSSASGRAPTNRPAG